MSTYSNIKMGEIFVIYGNPFSRKNWRKNIKQALCIKYYKRVNFTSNFAYNTSSNLNLLPLKHLKDSLSLINNNNNSQFNFHKINIENKKKTFQEKDNFFNITKNKNYFQRNFTLNHDTLNQKFQLINDISKSSSDIFKNHLKLNQFDEKLTLNYDKKEEYIDEISELNLEEKSNDISNENKITNFSEIGNNQMNKK